MRQLNNKAGEQVRLHIRASDISLARHRVEESSVLNILPVQIDAIATPINGQTLVRLRSQHNGASTLMARITQRSCEQLQLKEGRGAADAAGQRRSRKTGRGGRS